MVSKSCLWKSRVLSILCLISLFILPDGAWGQSSNIPTFVPKMGKEWAKLRLYNRASFGDFDKDGYPDLILGGRVWKNDHGYFIPYNKKLKITRLPVGGIWADFNNDGYLDIFCYGDKFSLWINQGGKQFKSYPIPANPYPGHGVAAAVGDLNNDGYVDIYVANYETWTNNTYPYKDVFLFNNWKQWSSSPPSSNIPLFHLQQTSIALPSRGVTMCDFNNDGKLEIYVSEYRLAPNMLWCNPSGNSFIDLSTQYNVRGYKDGTYVRYGTGMVIQGVYGHTIGSCWADLNNDLNFDLVVGNFAHPVPFQDRLQILKNQGPSQGYVFKKIHAKRHGIRYQESYANPSCADFDNDGKLDIFISTVYGGNQSVLYRNLGKFKFEEVTTKVGFKWPLNTYQGVWADVNNDGFLDLLAAGKIWINRGNGNHWLKVSLEGKDCNRAAIGAKVIMRAGKRKAIRQVEAGTGAGNQNDLTLHFGLGKRSKKVKLEIHWPCGKVQHVKVRPNSWIHIQEN